MTRWDEAAFREKVQAELDLFLDDRAALLAPLGADAERLIDQARVSVSGGKRFRAAFCWGGFHAVTELAADAVPHDALIRACAALELLQASALVHDDLMDASDTRRGRPATHRHFENQHAESGWTGPSTAYGAAGAILVGDMLLAWSDEMRRSGFGWDVLGPALEIFDECRTEVIAGQFLDVSVQARGHADVATAMTVLRYKSAKYSIERPLHIGAALAGATTDQLATISEFGLPWGEAFQLRDDILGVFGDAEVTGKPAGDDLVEGKRTVLVAHTLNNAASADAEFLDSALGTALSGAEVDRIRTLMTESGALDAVETAIEQLTAEADTALTKSGFNPSALTMLAALGDAATQRVR